VAGSTAIVLAGSAEFMLPRTSAQATKSSSEAQQTIGAVDLLVNAPTTAHWVGPTATEVVSAAALGATAEATERLAAAELPEAMAMAR